MTEFRAEGDTFAHGANWEESGRDRSLRILTHVLYALYALSGLTGGISALVALIFNYARRAETRGTLYESHFTWQIRTFWIGLGVFLVGMLLAIVFVGFIVMWVAAIWTLYRVIKGWLYLHDRKPLPARVTPATRRGRGDAPDGVHDVHDVRDIHEEERP